MKTKLSGFPIDRKVKKRKKKKEKRKKGKKIIMSNND